MLKIAGPIIRSAMPEPRSPDALQGRINLLARAPMSIDGHEERQAVIRPIGASQPVDAGGFIVNTCAADLIGEPWSSLVSDLLVQCLEELGGSLHSLQLRGSVPRGIAVEGISDLDVFCITNGRHPKASAWADRMARRVEVLYPFCRGLDLRVWPLCDLVGLPSGHPARFLLKTQGLCIWGPDVTADWPPVPLEHAQNALKALPVALERMRMAIARRSPADEALMVARCRWLAKKVVRAGFELVAPLERAYTRDLHPCWQGFARHHRALTTPMEEVLLLAIRPTARTNSLTKIIEVGELVLLEARRNGELL
jgi:hypothetical protein